MDIRSKNRSFAWCDNGWIDLALRFILGGIFVMASFHKITEPAVFAKIVFGYDLFPAQAINLIAILLPYIELTMGLSLIAGVYPRAAAVILGALLLAFILAISINMLRGHVFDCGCFSSGEAKLWPNTPMWTLGRNVLLGFLCWFILAFKGRRVAVLLPG